MPARPTLSVPLRTGPSADQPVRPVVGGHEAPLRSARPLRRDAEANRQQILEAAGRLMAERGLAAPLEDIAAAAGVGIGTLYRRFPTRDELIQALFLDRVESFLSDLETAVAMDDGWEGFVWFMRRSVSRQIDDRALSELLWHDAADGLLRDLRERVWPLAEELVRRAQATGRLRPDLTASDVALLQQMVVHVGELLRPVNDDAWQRVFVLVLDGMVTSRPGPAELRWPAPTVDELDEVRCGVKGRPLPGRPG